MEGNLSKQQQQMSTASNGLSPGKARSLHDTIAPEEVFQRQNKSQHNTGVPSYMPGQGFNINPTGNSTEGFRRQDGGQRFGGIGGISSIQNNNSKESNLSVENSIKTFKDSLNGFKRSPPKSYTVFLGSQAQQQADYPISREFHKQNSLQIYDRSLPKEIEHFSVIGSFTKPLKTSQQFRRTVFLDQAVLLIQRFWRSYKLKKGHQYQSPYGQGTQTYSSGIYSQLQSIQSFPQNTQKVDPLPLGQQQEEEATCQRFFEMCATLIQKSFRGYSLRKKHFQVVSQIQRFHSILWAAIQGWRVRRIMQLRRMQDLIQELKPLIWKRRNLIFSLRESLPKVRLEDQSEFINAKEQKVLRGAMLSNQQYRFMTTELESVQKEFLTILSRLQLTGLWVFEDKHYTKTVQTIVSSFTIIDNSKKQPRSSQKNSSNQTPLNSQHFPNNQLNSHSPILNSYPSNMQSNNQSQAQLNMIHQQKQLIQSQQQQNFDPNMQVFNNRNQLTNSQPSIANSNSGYIYPGAQKVHSFYLQQQQQKPESKDISMQLGSTRQVQPQFSQMQQNQDQLGIRQNQQFQQLQQRQYPQQQDVFPLSEYPQQNNSYGFYGQQYPSDLQLAQSQLSYQQQQSQQLANQQYQPNLNAGHYQLDQQQDQKQAKQTSQIQPQQQQSSQEPQEQQSKKPSIHQDQGLNSQNNQGDEGEEQKAQVESEKKVAQGFSWDDIPVGGGRGKLPFSEESQVRSSTPGTTAIKTDIKPTLPRKQKIQKEDEEELPVKKGQDSKLDSKSQSSVSKKAVVKKKGGRSKTDVPLVQIGSREEDGSEEQKEQDKEKEREEKLAKLQNLKKRMKYDPRKAIQNQKSGISNPKSDEDKKEEDNNDSKQEEEGENQAEDDQEPQQTLVQKNRKSSPKKTPSKKEVVEVSSPRDQVEEGGGNFLKRQSQKMVSQKLSWKKIESRIDCWSSWNKRSKNYSSMPQNNFVNNTPTKRRLPVSSGQQQAHKANNNEFSFVQNKLHSVSEAQQFQQKVRNKFGLNGTNTQIPEKNVMNKFQSQHQSDWLHASVNENEKGNLIDSQPVSSMKLPTIDYNSLQNLTTGDLLQLREALVPIIQTNLIFVEQNDPKIFTKIAKEILKFNNN